MATDRPITGTEEEQKLFTVVDRHYNMATEDLTVRMKDFDAKDILFRSHIVESNWPYQTQVFDPRTFTALYEKTARILANKPRGRMIPREGGDVLGAKINNEILSFQWDDSERADGVAMLAKWALMDLSARKYGAAFALTSWRYQRETTGEGKQKTTRVLFDGPTFRPWNNRDVLANPSYSTIKQWIQLRDYLTLDEMLDSNDAARGKPIYKNLDILRQALKEEAKSGGDMRSSNYVVKNLEIKGLVDYLGQDEYNKVVEIITEYRSDQWITFSPKHGIILRDIPNPYKHGQIPVVLLKYYPIDDDIYGLSEIEPVEKIQRAINALVCQYLDAINMSLYAPLKVRSVGGAVQMHTLEFGPGAKWLMTDPATDVLTHDQQISGVTEFTSTYRFLVGAMQEALGETSAAVSNLVPGAEGKTATEVKDLALSRSARDNFNQMFLGEAIKKQMMLWYQMNQQFLFSDPSQKHKIIRIVGKDAIKYFQGSGLDAMALSDQSIELLSSPEMEDVDVRAEELMEPLYPIQGEKGVMPKFSVDDTGQFGELYVEPGDLSGMYDYIPDVGSMNAGANDQMIQAKTEALSLLGGVNPRTGQPSGFAAMLMQEGKRVKASDLIIDYLEDIGFKNADQYIENAEGGAYGQAGGVQGGQALLAGGAGAPGGGIGMGGNGNAGLQAGNQAILGGQAQPVVS